MLPTVRYLSVSERHRHVTRRAAGAYAHPDGVLFVGTCGLDRTTDLAGLVTGFPYWYPRGDFITISLINKLLEGSPYSAPQRARLVRKLLDRLCDKRPRR